MKIPTFSMMSKMSLGSAARSVLLALIVALPILYLPVSWSALAHGKVIFIVIAAVVSALLWTILIMVRGKIVLPKSVLLPIAAALPIVYLGSALLSQAPGALVGSGIESDTAAMMALWFLLLAFSSILFLSGNWTEKVFKGLLVSFLLVEIYQLLGFIFGTGLSLGFLSLPAASLLGSWHDLGIFLALAVGFSLATLDSILFGKRWRAVAWLVLILAFPILVIINVADVWIAIALFALLVAGFSWFVGWKSSEQQLRVGMSESAALETGKQDEVAPHRLAFGTSVLVLMLAVAFFFVGGSISAMLPTAASVVQNEIRPSWQGTVAVVSSVYDDGGLVFGSGPNTFDRQWALYKPTGVNETAFWNADFIQGVGFVPTAFITVGVLGAVAWIAFLIAVLTVGIRAMTSAAVLGNRRWNFPFIALLLSIVYLWVMTVIYTPSTSLIALAFILTGVLVALATRLGTIPVFEWEFARSKYGFLFIVFPVIAVLGSGAAGIGVARALTADLLVNRSITIYNSTGDVAMSQGSINQALTVYPNYDRALRAAVELSLVRFNQLSEDSNVSDEVRAQLQSVLQQAIANGLSAVSADSTNYVNWLTLAGVYQQLAGAQVEGAYDNAKKAYENAISANPSNPLPYLQLAQLSALQNDLAGTREYLKEALNRKSNFTDALYLLSQLEVAEGNMESAYNAAIAAVQSAQNEPLLWYQLGVIAYSRDMLGDAVSALSQAVALNSNYANALYVLGQAYYKSGDDKTALAVFERVASLNPENAAIAQIVATLKAGEKLPDITQQQQGETAQN